MKTDDIEKVVIIVEFNNGNAHQVLTTKENKKILIGLLATMDNGLKLSGTLEPVAFTTANHILILPHAILFL